jgi:hypothetical protein
LPCLWSSNIFAFIFLLLALVRKHNTNFSAIQKTVLIYTIMKEVLMMILFAICASNPSSILLIQNVVVLIALYAWRITWSVINFARLTIVNWTWKVLINQVQLFEGCSKLLILISGYFIMIMLSD